MYRTHYNKEEKLWSGDDLTPIYNPKVSLGEIIFQSLRVNGSRIAQVNQIYFH